MLSTLIELAPFLMPVAFLAAYSWPDKKATNAVH